MTTAKTTKTAPKIALEIRVAKAEAALSADKARMKKEAEMIKAREDQIEKDRMAILNASRTSKIKRILDDHKKKFGFYEDPKLVKDALSANQKNIIVAFREGSWGCQKESVRKLVSALSGIAIGQLKDASTKVLDNRFGKMVPGRFAVPTCNENSHDYTIDSVVFAMFCANDHHCSAISEKHYKDTGNNLEIKSGGLRRPTATELKKFLETTKIETFAKIVKELGL